MNKKFRVLSIVLIAMMILTLVAGCGKKTEDEGFDISAEGSLSGEKTDTATKPDASEDEEGDKTETPTEDTEKQDETPNEDTDKSTEETPSDTDKTEPETPDEEQKEEQKEPSADSETPSDDEKEPEQKPVEKPEPEQPQVTVTIPDISSVAEMNAQQALTALKGLPYGKLMEAWASYLAEDNADSRYGIYTFDLTNIRVDYDENNLITGVSFEAVDDEEETEEEE